MKNFLKFIALTRNELRSTNGGRLACISNCVTDSDCKSNSPNGYCSTVPCSGSTKKVCALNDPQPPSN